METKLNIQTDKKEYPELTLSQLETLVDLLNQGYTEKEAMAEVIK